LKIFVEVKIAMLLGDFFQKININGITEFMRYLISTLYSKNVLDVDCQAQHRLKLMIEP
jgi:hypothetical protein